MDPDDVRRSVPFTPDIGPHDAAALFWWARNSLFFSAPATGQSGWPYRRYFDLVNHPGVVMRRAHYDFVGRPIPATTSPKMWSPIRLDAAATSPQRRRAGRSARALLARLDASPGMRIDLRQDAAQAAS